MTNVEYINAKTEYIKRFTASAIDPTDYYDRLRLAESLWLRKIQRIISNKQTNKG